MWKLTVKGFFAKKIRFLLTGLAVVLGVAFMVGTMVFADTIQHSFDQLFAEIGQGTDAVVRSKETFDAGIEGGEQRALLPGSLVDEVRKVPGVEFAAGNVELPAQIIGTDGEPVGTPQQGAPTFGLAWTDNRDLNQFTIVEGRPPRLSDEVAIDRGSAKEGDIHVGDRIKIKVQPEVTEFEVVGIAKFGDADSPLGASVSLFTPRAAQVAAGYTNQFSSISVVAGEGVSQEQVAANLRQALAGESNIEVITGEEQIQENQDTVREALGFFNIGLLIFAIVALVVGSFIIYNTFNIVVAQRTRELALLRAVGASRRQVMTSVLGESALVGLVAAGIGVVTGVFLSLGLKALLALFGIDIPGTELVVTAQTILIGIVVGMTVTLLSAVLPARRASRVPPVAAMRDVAVERRPHVVRRSLIGGAILALGAALILRGLFGNSDILLVGIGALVIFVGTFVLAPTFSQPVARALGWPIAKIRGTTGTLARENAARNPYRTAATAAALMIGVSLVGFITIFAASTKASIWAAIDDQFKTDYIVTSGSNLGFAPSLAEGLSTLPELDAVVPVRFDMFVADGSTSNIIGSEPDGAEDVIDPGMVQGSLSDLGLGDVAISKEKADDKGWKVGDEIPVTFTKTGAGDLRVAAIYDESLFLGDYVISLDTWDQNFDRRLDFIIMTRLKPGVSPEEGRRAMESVLEQDPTAELQDQAQYKADQEAQINAVVNLVYALLALAVIIAVIGIANTLALSIFERTRELGLLRAVGMARSQVRSSVRWESVIIALFGTALGLIIGLFFGFVVVLALRDEGFTRFAAAPGQLLIVVVVAILCGIGAAWLPARKAAKLDMLEAIATQ
jgi:putative ABC transport system permease protein